MESILRTEKGICYACGCNRGYELHHIFFNALRPIADREGLTCYLCAECHRGTYGVHGREGNALNRELKHIAQQRWEFLHSHEEWMTMIGRNYID
jgi:hypothetical protein